MTFIVWYISGLFLFTLFLAVGGFILQRDRYWRRIWQKLGKPNVDSIGELKDLYQKRHIDNFSESNHRASK